MQRRDLVSILMGDRLGIPDDVSFLCSHLTSYITTVIVVVVVVEKERFPRNSGESITNLCLFHETRTSCLMTTVSIRNMCKNRQMVSFQISDASVQKKHHLHSLIHTNSALTNATNLHQYFFLGTLYLCNGGWILTVVLALQPYSIHHRFLMCSFPWCSAARVNPLKHKKKKKK